DHREHPAAAAIAAGMVAFATKRDDVGILLVELIDTRSGGVGGMLSNFFNKGSVIQPRDLLEFAGLRGDLEVDVDGNGVRHRTALLSAVACCGHLRSEISVC